MFRLFNCIVVEHDHLTVLLAALICGCTVACSFRTFKIAIGYTQRRQAWVLFAALSAGGGIWATHFLAMLAYHPPVPVGYDLTLTFISLALACVATTVGFTLCARGKSPLLLLGGAIIGVGICAMHYVGMMAMQLPGRMVWDPLVVCVSIVLAIGLAAASTYSLRQQGGVGRFGLACGLMGAAICSLHFVAMSALTIVPDPTVLVTVSMFNRAVLTIGIAGVTALVLGGGIAALTIERLRGRIAAQVASLKGEVEERRRAERALLADREMSRSHQAAMARLMQDNGVRAGSMNDAMRRMMKALTTELKVDRVGVMLLDNLKTGVILRETYDLATASFLVPELFGTPDHLRAVKALAAKWIVAIDDVVEPNALDPDIVRGLQKIGAQSILYAPIIAHGELVGFITCLTLRRKLQWAAPHRMFALEVSNLAALVVERHQRLDVEAQAKGRAERLERQQALLNNLMRSDSIRTGKLETVFGNITAELCKEMSVDRVSIRLFGDVNDEHVLTEVFVAEENRVMAVPRSGKRRYPQPLADVLKDGVIAVSDCAIDPLTVGIYARVLEPRRIRAMLHAPVQNGGDIIGVVQCSTYDTPREWFPEDLLLASGVANLVALASERRLRIKIENSLRDAHLVAEEANRAKSLFLASMSHEIRTPMNGVLGMTDVLIRSGLSERQLRLANTIGESGRALLTIINDILDLSRIEVGKLELEQQAFDLGGCVEDAVELLSEQAHKKGLDLSLLVEDAALGSVTGDAVRLRQVLVNLIGNAIKFTESGEVRVQVAVVAGEGGGVRFTVRDTGIGIDADVQAKLFRPFSQADTSITRRFGGTGLGLSISRNIVETMGGTMSLESVPGTGTRISFVVPFEVMEVSGTERSRNAKLSGCRILVVDDSTTNCEIITSYLAAVGAVIETAESGEQGLVKLEAARVAGTPFELVVVDLVMDGMNGIDFGRRVKASADIGGVHLVMLSSMSWVGDASEVRRAGIDRLLHKPIRRGELVAAVNYCLVQGEGGDVAEGGQSDFAAKPSPKLRLRALVAEDNPVNQVVAEEYLNSLGCFVTIAENGVQALAAIRRETFDVVLMDCQMPEMDGYTATEEIRADEALRGLPALPIIAVTANAFEADRQRCLQAGMNGYLSKPYSEEQLSAVLAPFVAGRGNGAVEKIAPEAEHRERSPTTGKAAAKRAKPQARADESNRPGKPGATTPRSSVAKPSQRGKHRTGAKRDGRPSADPVADPVAVSARIPVLRPDLRAKLLRTFVAHAPLMMSALLRAVADGDAVAVGLAVHSLRSSSANVAEAEIARLAGVIEADARKGDLSRVSGLVTEIADRIGVLVDRNAGDQRGIKRA